MLLPQLGSRWGLIATSALATLSSMALAWSQRKTNRPFAVTVAVVAPMLFLMSARVAVDPFNVAFERFHGRERLLWREEGAQTTVAIHERPGNPPMRIMYLDGNHHANDSASTAFVHHRIGALPVMLHQQPRTAVVGGSAFFKNINFDLLARPNVRLHVDDGRNFLLMNRKKYDVITADIILPRHAGAGSLYSREYFELVRKSLADGGLVMQWNGGDSATEYKLLLRTFLSVFPHTTLWVEGGLMLGSTRPFTISRTAYEVRRQTFEQFPWDLATLKRIYTAGPEEAKAFAGDGPVLSDDKPVIEYFLSLPKNDTPGGYSGPIARFEHILTP